MPRPRPRLRPRPPLARPGRVGLPLAPALGALRPRPRPRPRQPRHVSNDASLVRVQTPIGSVRKKRQRDVVNQLDLAAGKNAHVLSRSVAVSGLPVNHHAGESPGRAPSWPARIGTTTSRCATYPRVPYRSSPEFHYDFSDPLVGFCRGIPPSTCPLWRHKPTRQTTPVRPSTADHDGFAPFHSARTPLCSAAVV